MQGRALFSRRVLILGVDGLDWNLLHPLLDAGRLPHLARLVDFGVIATLDTSQPLLAPLLWTTVATGQLASRHGIFHARFPDPADPTGQRDQPAGATGRLAPTLWELATRAGLRAHVIGWPATSPAEPTAGAFVSDDFPFAPEDASDGRIASPAPDQLAAGSTCAPDLAEALAELRVRPGEIAASDLRALVPDLDLASAGNDLRISQLATSLAAAASRHAAATWVLESEPDWQLALFYYPFLAELGRVFMGYHPPRRRHVSPADFATYRLVMTGAHALFDAMLKRLLDLAGKDTTLLLVSTRGFLTGSSRPAPGPGEQADAVDCHRPAGLAVLSGPGVRRDERLDHAALPDILPTALTLLGLPVPADLPGRVWREALADHGDATPGKADETKDEENQSRIDFSALSGRLLAAHPPAGADLPPGLAVAWETRYNLARHLLAAGHAAEALPVFEEILRVQPTRAGPELHRIQCLLALGCTEECSARLEALAARPHGGLRSFGGKRPAYVPQFDFLRGVLALSANLPLVALEHFNRARRARTQLPGLHVELGRVLLRLGRPQQAAGAFRRALAVGPDDPGANLGAAWAALRLRRFQVAADRALRAATRAPQESETHLVLGLALGHLGRRRPAAVALRRALALHPGWRIAHRVLARWLRDDPVQAAVAGMHALAGRPRRSPREGKR